MNARNETFAMAMAAAASARPLPSRARRAALLLHTVSADDRAWLLAQLSDEERHLMEPLVSELRELGIPIDPELLAEAAGEGALVARLPALASTALAGADPALVARMLAAEPLDLIARLLALGPWAWSGDVLATLSPIRREQLRGRLAAASRPNGPRSLLDARLLELVEARLVRMAQEPSPTARENDRLRAGRRAAIVPAWLRRWLALDGASRATGARE